MNGSQQIGDIPIRETWAPAVKTVSLRIAIALAAHYGLELGQLDIKQAFLNAEMRKELYVWPPKQFARPGYVWLLLKALYGTHEAAKLWYDTFKTRLVEYGLSCSGADPCLFFKHQKDGSIFIFCLHVDDGIVVCKNTEMKNHFIQFLRQYFPVTDQGVLKEALGIEFVITDQGIGMKQESYVNKVLGRLEIKSLPPVTTPCLGGKVTANKYTNRLKKFSAPTIAGLLLWLPMQTRPDLSYSVAKLTQFTAKSQDEFYIRALRILQYLAGTKSLGIFFRRLPGKLSFFGYADSDWAGDPADRRSQTGYIFISANGPTEWASKKQSTVSLSVMEGEIMAVTSAAQSVYFQRNVFSELKLPFPKPFCIYEDNQGTICLSETSVIGKRTRHMDLRFKFLNQAVQDGIIKLIKIPGTKNIADMFTKPLSRDLFNNYVSQIWT